MDVPDSFLAFGRGDVLQSFENRVETPVSCSEADLQDSYTWTLVPGYWSSSVSRACYSRPHCALQENYLVRTPGFTIGQCVDTFLPRSIGTKQWSGDQSCLCLCEYIF